MPLKAPCTTWPPRKSLAFLLWVGGGNETKHLSDLTHPCRLSETQTEQEDRIRGLVPGTRLLSLCLAEGL